MNTSNCSYRSSSSPSSPHLTTIFGSCFKFRTGRPFFGLLAQEILQWRQLKLNPYRSDAASKYIFLYNPKENMKGLQNKKVLLMRPCDRADVQTIFNITFINLLSDPLTQIDPLLSSLHLTFHYSRTVSSGSFSCAMGTHCFPSTRYIIGVNAAVPTALWTQTPVTPRVWKHSRCFVCVDVCSVSVALLFSPLSPPASLRKRKILMKGWVITPLNINVIMGLKWSHIPPRPPPVLPLWTPSRTLLL